jgi:hypothetical protein
MVAVRKDRDAKAELNRRDQACEVLIGTGISRRVKMGDAPISQVAQVSKLPCRRFPIG